MNRLIIVRHGKTSWNKLKKIQGRTDVELNEDGIIDTYRLKDQINLDGIDLCICSPLIRTKQTAAILTENNIDIIYDELLLERDFGDFEGTLLNMDLIEKSWNYHLNYSENNLESMHDCLDRAKKFIDKINNTYQDKTILVITHSCMVKTLHYNIIGYDENTNFLEFVAKNTTLYNYEI